MRNIITLVLTAVMLFAAVTLVAQVRSLSTQSRTTDTQEKEVDTQSPTLNVQPRNDGLTPQSSGIRRREMDVQPRNQMETQSRQLNMRSLDTTIRSNNDIQENEPIAQDIKDSMVTLRVVDAPISEVLRALMEASGAVLYNQIMPNRKQPTVTIEIVNEPFMSALKKVVKTVNETFDLTYRIVDERSIYIGNAEEVMTESQG